MGSINIGPQLEGAPARGQTEDQGFCIAIVATGSPPDARQLGAGVAKRVSGLARLGSYIGYGSGEVFWPSIANAYDPAREGKNPHGLCLPEETMDLPSRLWPNVRKRWCSMLLPPAPSGSQVRPSTPLTGAFGPQTLP